MRTDSDCPNNFRIEHFSRRLLQTVLAIFSFSCGCSAAWLAQAEDYFVNNMVGDDRNTGRESGTDTRGNLNGPFRTIGRALMAAKTGDRIFIEKTEEPYRESISIQGPQHNGSAIKKLHIYSNGAIIDGTRPALDRWELVDDDLYRFLPERKSHQQLYRNGRPIPITRLAPNATISSLKRGQWTLDNGYIYFKTDGRHPEAFGLSYCFHSVGITLYQAHNVVIEGIVVQGFALDGINAHDSVFDSMILSCIVRGNGRSGVSIGGASQVELIACLVGDNAVSQLRTEGFSTTWVENCEFIQSKDFGTPIQNSGGQILGPREVSLNRP
ncbi:MAG TPA: right-handed parallel beta-helix repeat-containing protein [Pirellulaceae bacterium]|nr:right-handed parallel beta-helix repeat-containing protein [Pirellulaceae bacterium]HMO92416.1 right-handed parallel beta-helix repeat-containing protein [Pirellulaceae bacterium]HMP69535.1 right-handed parallel beta-helix repeat-containing protein [Pirellulaceae bacterium]